MSKSLEPSANNKGFIVNALKKELRLDGRSLTDFRDLKIEFGEDYGQVDISLGSTRVMARISAEITKPYSDRPFDGIFAITTELTPLASPAFETGRVSEQEVIISRLIEQAIRRSNALDTESLCIISGQKCWSVRASVHFINHDGNLVDAACIAVITGLCHFRRPEITVLGDEVTVHSIEERVPVPLSVLHTPICVTFSFFEDGSLSAIDASLEEEELRTGSMTVTLNKNREICQIFKAGGVTIEASSVVACAHTAFQKTTSIISEIQRALDEDLSKKETQFFGGSAENQRS
ncbi:exosome subunit Rrp45 [Schizosaccharomyces cryophilus OY26]|uniref:Exosome complex component RRP45 n=1 Tax=Schizosaccharomyces cryophilus (strain OY26 / ATCC MYA-4695 / CBS 11777 / NBRC 106824 / NRRL Y48691) TaxID=653667 RepID=S9X396_SCHCR|nr:exosome subunit Rrp45 [Schizosaccharomyces cryophilus OY26]EPY51582.1 exosome subunit Rrp45 [Schizosaccharomyces cryophilus OY26]